MSTPVEQSLKTLIETLTESSERFHLGNVERDRLLQKQLDLQERKLRGFKYLAIVAAIGLVILGGNVAHTVRTFENDMNTMADDMDKMRIYMQSMSRDMHAMNGHMGSMDVNMNAMNQNIAQMTPSITTMSEKMSKMSSDMGSMTPAIQSMDHGMRNMSRDMNAMNRAISPVAGGMQQFIPWQ